MTLLNYRKSVAVLLPDTFVMIILFSDNSMPVFCISIFYPDFQSA